MSSSSLSSSTALIVAATAATAAAATIVAAVVQQFSSTRSTTSSTSKALVKKDAQSTNKHNDDDDDATDATDFITAEDVISIFDKLFLEMQAVVAQLGQQIQQLQMSGAQIPEKELRNLLKIEFERAVAIKQDKIFESHDVDEDCLAEATWEFLEQESEYPNVKKAVERFQKLYENISGEKVVGRRPGDGAADKNDKSIVATAGTAGNKEPLSQERLVQVAQVYFDAMTASMLEVVKDFKSKHGANINDPVTKQQLHMQLGVEASSAGEDALKKMDLTLDIFRASIEKHSSSPEVGRVLSMLQMKQQQEMMAMGVPM